MLVALAVGLALDPRPDPWGDCDDASRGERIAHLLPGLLLRTAVGAPEMRSNGAGMPAGTAFRRYGNEGR